jgi:hypothetical protein
MNGTAPHPDSDWLAGLLANGTPVMRRVWERREELRLQMLLRVLREPLAPAGTPSHPLPDPRLRWVAGGPLTCVWHQLPSATVHALRDSAEYFYPASTIKLGAIVTALQVVRELRCAGAPITRRTPLRYEPSWEGALAEDRDPSNLDGGVITVEHDLRRVCLVSDNPAHNRLYTLTGHREINERLWRLGLSSVRINHRLAEPRLTWEQHRTSGRVLFLDRSGRTLAEIPPRVSDLLIDNTGSTGLLIGRRHIDPMTGELRDGPFDFTRRNRISLNDLQHLLAAVCSPGQGDIDEEDRLAVCLALAQTPAESANPVYPGHTWPSQYAKWLLPGLRRIEAQDSTPDGFVIFNKIGRAYGFTTENALVVHRPSGRAMLLAATLYTNEDGIMNADTYQYAELADAFFADLGERLGRALISGELR